MQRIKNFLPILITALVVGGLAGLRMAGAQIEDVTNFTGLQIKATNLGTATPLAEFWRNSTTGQSLVVRDGRGTPRVMVEATSGAITLDGPVTQSGAVSQSGLQTLTGGAVISPNLVVQGPLAKGTATPGVTIIEPSTQGSQALVIKGNATATPYLELNATRALYINNALQYGSVGVKENCGTQSITAAATVVHALSTPVVVNCSIAGDPTGSQFCTYTNSAGVVTVKVWQEVASTPVANGAAVTVGWCVKGTP
jgi:hypothetical protein